jgi:hypothetical protein
VALPTALVYGQLPYLVYLALVYLPCFAPPWALSSTSHGSGLHHRSGYAPNNARRPAPAAGAAWQRPGSDLTAMPCNNHNTPSAPAQCNIVCVGFGRRRTCSRDSLHSTFSRRYQPLQQQRQPLVDWPCAAASARRGAGQAEVAMS